MPSSTQPAIRAPFPLSTYRNSSITAMASVNCTHNSMVLTNLLRRNEKWVEAMKATDDQFFPVHAQSQKPKVSLIFTYRGC